MLPRLVDSESETQALSQTMWKTEVLGHGRRRKAASLCARSHSAIRVDTGCSRMADDAISRLQTHTDFGDAAIVSISNIQTYILRVRHGYSDADSMGASCFNGKIQPSKYLEDVAMRRIPNNRRFWIILKPHYRTVCDSIDNSSRRMGKNGFPPE